MKAKNNRILHFILVIAILLYTTIINKNEIYADLDDCDGMIFTDTRSGKRACIFDGWKKETRNSNPTNSDFFYYKDTDIFVSWDSHEYYNDLSESDKTKYTRESFASYTSSNSEIEKYAESNAAAFAKELGINVTGSTIMVDGWEWGVMNQDYSPLGYDVKTTVYYRVIDGYWFSIGIQTGDLESEKLAKSVLKDLNSQIKNTEPVTPSMSPEGEKINKDQALTDGFLAGLKTFITGSLLFYIFRKVKSYLNKNSNQNNIKPLEEETVTKPVESTRDIKKNDPLSELNSKFFPNNCRNHVEKQMRLIIGDSIPNDEYLKIYVYCMTHYLVNNENYGYVIRMLPAAHPELKDKETIKQIAAYTFLCSTGKPDKINLSNKDTYALLESTVDALDTQNVAREGNINKNKEPFDEERGIIREKPMYFAGAKNAESYLNSLTDLDGNKLHFGGIRITYSVDGIPEILDNYQIFREDGTKYGDLYLSIYGKDNYPYVPKGYKHPTLKNPKESSAFRGVEKADKDINSEENSSLKNVEKTGEDINIENTSKIDQEPLQNNEKPFFANNKDGEEIKPSSFSEAKIPVESRINASVGIKFCRKCGTELMPGTRFCRKCGTKIEL